MKLLPPYFRSAIRPPFLLLPLLSLTVSVAAPARAQLAPATQAGSIPPEPASEPEAGAGDISFNFETDFNSRYVFRGLALSQGPVVQPGLYFSKGGSTLGFWANINATRRGGEDAMARQANEVDVTYVHSIEHGRDTIEPSAVIYLYPTNLAPTTGEVSLRLAHSLGKYSFFTSHTIDMIRYEGAYFGEVGVSREHEWSPLLSGEAKIHLGFANAKFNEVNIGPHQVALDVAAVDLSVTRKLSPSLYVRPHLNYTRILGHDLRNALDEPTLWNFGLALGSDF